MKEILISSFIIIFIIIGNYYTENITTNSVKNINESLAYIRELVNEEKNDEIDNEIKIIEEHWNEIKEKLSFYIEHNEIEKVDTEITVLKSNIETRSYDECIVSIDKSNFILKHIEEKGKFKLKNIF